MTSDISQNRLERAKVLNGSAYGTFMLAKRILEEKDVIDSWEKPDVERVFKPRSSVHEKIKEDWDDHLSSLL